MNSISSIGENSPVKPLLTITPTARALHPVASLAALTDVGDTARRKAIITYLQDNIVPLVGPDAAEALGNLLDRTALRDEANDFANKALGFHALLERGMHSPSEAADEWRRRQRQKG